MPEVSFPNLNIEIQHLSDTFINIFGFEIKWYAILIITGVLTGLYLAVKEAKRTGQDPDNYFDYLNYAIIAAIIGARLYYVIYRWEEFKNDIWRIFNIRTGGLALYGGIIAAFAVAYFYTKKKKLNLKLFFDTIAPSIAIGQVIGRCGNFFNKEVFGGSTDSLFAMRLSLENANLSFVSEDMIRFTDGGQRFIQVHPTFLYESFWNLCLFFILIIIRRKYKKFDGEIIALYLLGYGIGRTWIEAMRTDQLLIGSTNIPVSVVLSVILIVSSLMYLIYEFKILKTKSEK